MYLVVVQQQRQRNVQKSVLYVQSCFFLANLIDLLLLLLLFLFCFCHSQCRCRLALYDFILFYIIL